MKAFVNIIYTNISKTAFWTCLLTSIGLLIASVCIPPYGIIDPSILKGVAEIFGFATLGVVGDAVRKGTDVTLRKGDVELQVNNPDNEKEDTVESSVD